jgi:hypothetical protein
MLVLTAFGVAPDRWRAHASPSTNASRSRGLARKGWRLASRTWRRPATSWRFCSRACRAFPACRPAPAQHPPDGWHGGRRCRVLGQSCHPFVERDLALGRDAGLEPTGHPRQLAMSAAIALLSRRQEPSLAPRLHQVVDASGWHAKVPGRLTVSVAFVDRRNDPRSKHPSDAACPPDPLCLLQQKAITSQRGWEPEA